MRQLPEGIHAMDLLVPSAMLVSHPLWHGSILQQRYALGILTITDVRKRAEKLARADDRDIDEDNLLELLKNNIALYEEQWDFG